jgi:hydrogenase maturation protease
MSAARAALIGVGNPYRRDDGIGPALIAEVARYDPPGVTLTVTDGEPTQLIDAWTGAELVVVVDAVLCDPATPGRIHRSTGASLLRTASASTHGLGIPDAVQLAKLLGLAPQRLVLFAVEASDVGLGVGLSPAVTAAMPALTRAVLTELGLELPDPSSRSG